MRKWLKRIFEGLLALAVIAGAAWFYFNSEGPGLAEGRMQADPPVVTAWPVMAATVRDIIHSPGTLQAYESVDLTASVSEKIASINFREGQAVKTGDLLVQLENAEQLATLGQAEIVLDEAQREFDRVSALWEKRVISSKEYEAQGTRLAAAKAAIELVQANLRDRQVLAPFDGMLGRRQVSPGHLVSPGTPITTLDDLGRMKVDFDVPEKYFSSLTPGLEFNATSVAYPGRVFKGRVRVVDPRIDPVTRSIQVRGIIGNDDLALRPGMLMAVELELSDRTAIEVPEKSVQSLGEMQFVFVMKGDVAERRTVVLGSRQDGQVEVVSGLAEGEEVVVEGAGKLRDGMTARLADPEVSELQAAL